MADGKLDHIIIDTAIVTLYTRIDRNKNRMSIETDNVERVNHAAPKCIFLSVIEMTKTASKIRFKAKLLRPAATAKGGSWSFLILPKNASAKLPTRGMTTVEGTINGYSFRATLEPDGQKSHWLKVTKKVREAAAADVGDVVTLEIMSAGEKAEPRVPADLRKALTAAPQARALWSDITPIAQRLDPLDYLRQAARDSRPSDQQCLRNARCWEATRLLLRSVWVL